METGLLHMTCPIPDPILEILLPVWKTDVLYISHALNKTIAECLENELVNITFPGIMKYCFLIASWEDQFSQEISRFPKNTEISYTFHSNKPS